jgi:hypothetical protein
MAPPPAAVGLTALTAKQYTVAALAATLAVAAVVTVFFVVLCPARVTFSVSHTSWHRSSEPTGSSLQLNLTLSIDNPSRSATVAYESMFVDVSSSTAESWIRATVTTDMPLWQPPRLATTVGATVALVAGSDVAFTGNMTSSSFTVTVTAQARFKVGVAWSRLYDIKVSCAPVSFFFPDAKAARPAGGAGRLPVKCV